MPSYEDMSKEEKIEWLNQRIKELNAVMGSAEDSMNYESTGFGAREQINSYKKEICKLNGNSQGCSIMGGRRYKKKRTTKRRKSAKKRKSTRRRKSYRK